MMRIKSIDTRKQSFPSSDRQRNRPWAAAAVIIGGMAALVIGLTLSVSVGVADIPFSVAWTAIFNFNPDSNQHQIIHELRLPRVLGGAMVGACFAVSGAIMQGLTRNPLADSGLLGLNAGAGFALALCLAFLPQLPYTFLILYSFIGAGISAALVFGMGSMARGGLTPIRLVLAGSALSALLIALSEGVALYFNIGQDLAFFYAGGASGIKWLHLKVMLPWVAAALIGAHILSRSITMLSLGEEVARGLGQRTRFVRLAGVLIVLILAGAAVSVIGAVGFVGLIIPHLARYLVGVDYRLIIPCSTVLGSVLLVYADLGARMINPVAETPIGALIALIGVPFFLYLARKERREL